MSSQIPQDLLDRHAEWPTLLEDSEYPLLEDHAGASDETKRCPLLSESLPPPLLPTRPVTETSSRNYTTPETPVLSVAVGEQQVAALVRCMRSAEMNPAEIQGFGTCLTSSSKGRSVAFHNVPKKEAQHLHRLLRVQEAASPTTNGITEGGQLRGVP